MDTGFFNSWTFRLAHHRLLVQESLISSSRAPSADFFPTTAWNHRSISISASHVSIDTKTPFC
jgi:hypothetical protein